MSVFRNDSFTEDEIFGDLEPHEDSSPINSILEVIWNVVFEITKLVVCVSSAVAASFLIYIFLKFEKVRKKCNIFLLHYAISSLIDVMLVPLVMLLSQIAFTGIFGWEVLCFIYSINSSTNILVFAFGAMIGFYWFIDNFHNSLIKNRKKFEIFTTILVYTVCSIKLAVVGGECFVEKSLYTSEILRITFFIIFLIIAGINIFVKRKTLTEIQVNTKYELTISSFLIFTYVPIFVLGFLFYFNLNPDWLNFVFYVYNVTEIVAFSGTLIVTYILYQKSKHFRVACKSIFKRSLKNYDEEELDEESEEEATGSNNNANLGFI
ncbi:uncharacterized protein LOC123015094 [Tribolium madens]|uniref:uncharacterized protein LOC123015094 n=1 Tax=Tribolium madens TaxID=41895 RepID=UPI001CF7417B|nr:uncharacterized protein LOC123015094 [Tribolium madens]